MGAGDVVRLSKWERTLPEYVMPVGRMPDVEYRPVRGQRAAWRWQHESGDRGDGMLPSRTQPMLSPMPNCALGAADVTVGSREADHVDFRLPFDPSLLTRFQAWKAGVHTRTGEPARDVRLWTCLYSEASADLVVAFFKLFWPDVIEVEGYVLLTEHYDQAKLANWLEWQRRTGGERWKLEATLNEVHLYHVFLADAALPVLEYLATVLARCWRTALREAFPERRFIVFYASEPEDYGPTLTIWQEDPPTA